MTEHFFYPELEGSSNCTTQTRHHLFSIRVWRANGKKYRYFYCYMLLLRMYMQEDIYRTCV
jgi:hypothetical protein